MIDTELLDKYLTENISVEDKKRVEDALESDSELRAKLSMLKIQKSHLKSHDDFQKSKQLIQQIGQEFSSPINKHSNFKLLYMLPFAATACLLLAFFFLPIQLHKSSEDLFAQYFEPSKISLIKRSLQDGDIQLKAQQAFNNADYRQANEYLVQLATGNNNDLDIQFYLAIAKIGSEDFNSALAILQELEQEQVYAAGAKWYAALSHLKLENTERASSLLQSIPETSSYYTRAASLLESL